MILHDCPECGRRCACADGEFGDEGDCMHDCEDAAIYEQCMYDLNDREEE